jgi:hypothetical protein
VPPKRRGRVAVIVAGVVALVVVAGAGGLFLLWPRLHRAADNTPTGTPTVRTAVPAVGLCYSSLPSAPDVENTADTDPVVPCDQQHYLETFAVGVVDDAAAHSPTDTLLVTLYNKCSDLAEQFLGQAWPSTFSWVVLSLPGDVAWTNGAHWYRCDIAGNTDILRQSPKTTTGSMHFKAPPITCFNYTRGALTPLDCTSPHTAEAVSAWTMPGQSDQNGTKPDGTRCVVDVDNFLNADISTVAGLQASTFTTQSYVVDQIILCVVQPTDPARTLSASVKNIGNKPLPYTP